MPMLSQRRSVFNDFTSPDHHVSSSGRPATASRATLKPHSQIPSRPRSEHGPPSSRLSHEILADDLDDDSIHTTKSRTKRFSLMRFRNLSESQLSVRAAHYTTRDEVPPVPAVLTPRSTSQHMPSIVKTAPTMDDVGSHEQHPDEPQGELSRSVRPSFFKRSHSRAKPAEEKPARKSMDEKRPKGRSSLRWRKLQGKGNGLEDLHRLSSMHVAGQHQQQADPPSYGDESHSNLALPVFPPRFSESSRSDGSNTSSGDHIYGSTTTTTHTVSTHTTFFRLPRRNKNRNSLFPLPIRIPPPEADLPDREGPITPRASTGGLSLHSARTADGQTSTNASTPPTILQRRHTEASSPTKHRGQHPPLPSPNAGLGKGSLSFAEPDLRLVRDDSQRSRGSSASSPQQLHLRLGARDRASTTTSHGRASHDLDTPPPMPGSSRNSTSTASRASLHGLLHFARFRQGSEPQSPRHGSPGSRSKSNSFAQSRETLVVPDREEGDSPSRYLERLEAAVARSAIAGILSKSADPFAQAVLRSYTRRFSFFGEPIDMSLRKFLLEAELPKETQQVDRVIQAFADRYHECNPGLFMTSDQAYIVAFSLMMLHTDAFNKNNKRKMQKHDYIKNTSGQHVADDVLACFYDNICYTPFVHYEEEVDVNGERIMPFKVKKSKGPSTLIEPAGKKPSGPLDPYNLLVESKLDMLRPPIKDHIAIDDPYNYRGSVGELDPHYLQRAFTHTGVLQIISARSRPAAYEGAFGQHNPNPTETQAGIVDLKITKVGTLWRKAAQKKKARSPWQEWGAVLTGSQLYLFKNAHWAKNLAHQFNSQQKSGQPRIPVIFKPPLHDFKPDALIKTDNAVALVDSTYNRHKHAFTFFRVGGQEEVLLADNEGELNDWLGLINYAAAFRAAGVRIRGMVGGNEEDLRARSTQSTDSAISTPEVQEPSRPGTVARGGLSPQLQRQVMAARRQIMVQKVTESEKGVADAVAQLENMLRNARHLLVLSPIGQKAREDVMHAAAKSDAMIKWLRRDIWRLKCHRDILAMDVQLDGYSASELQVLAERQAANAAEHQRKEQANLLARNESMNGPARSPPGTPTSPTRSGRASTTESIESLMSTDLFRTPPESMATQNPGQSEGYKLPPLQFDVRHGQGTSIGSTLLSISSPDRKSLSHASSTSSVRPKPLERVVSEVVSEISGHAGLTPTTSVDDNKVDMLARSTLPPASVTPVGPGGTTGLDGAPLMATPESNKHRGGVRRSLQKTLRDGHHHGSVHRHRRGKDSDGTMPSAAVDGENTEEGTPRLEREKGRFILHGKQASVIQFGNDWPNERMKARREQWHQDNESPSRNPSQVSDTTRSTNSSTFQTFTYGRSGDESGNNSTRNSYSLRSDAEAAEAFATSATHLDGGEAASYFDLASWTADDPEGNHTSSKRQTVIGPSSHEQDSAASSSALDGVVPVSDATEVTESGSWDFRTNRQTVIGPLSTNGGGGER